MWTTHETQTAESDHMQTFTPARESHAATLAGHICFMKIPFIWRLVAVLMMLEVEDKVTGALDIIYRPRQNRDTSV